MLDVLDRPTESPQPTNEEMLKFCAKLEHTKDLEHTLRQVYFDAYAAGYNACIKENLGINQKNSP